MKLHAWIFSALMCLSAPAGADVASLAWMQGSWAGQTGNSYLEESWSTPRAGTMVAAVRMSNDVGTVFTELIVIQQVEDGLILRLRQFGADLEPLTGIETLHMTQQTEFSVTFVARQPQGLRQVMYTRPHEGRLEIEVHLSEGGTFVANLIRDRRLQEKSK